MSEADSATVLGDPPPWSVALVDAELTAVSVHDGVLCIDLAALPRPGAAGAATLVVSQARLELGQARWQGDPFACLGRIAAAEAVTGDGKTWPLQLPQTLEQAVNLVLESAHGGRLSIRAASWSLRSRGAMRAVEIYPC